MIHDATDVELNVAYAEGVNLLNKYGLNAVLKAWDLLSGCAWTEVDDGIYARRNVQGVICFDDTLDWLTAIIDSEIIQELEQDHPADDIRKVALPPVCEFGVLIEPKVEAEEVLARPIPPSDALYLDRHDDMQRAMLMVPRLSETHARQLGFNSAEEAWLSSCESTGLDIQGWLISMENESPKKFPIDDKHSMHQW